MNTLNAILVNSKCKVVKSLINDFEIQDLDIQTCNNTNINPKEEILLQDLIENIDFLNYKDEYGRDIVNCDLKKIKQFR